MTSEAGSGVGMSSSGSLKRSASLFLEEMSISGRSRSSQGHKRAKIERDLTPASSIQQDQSAVVPRTNDDVDNTEDEDDEDDDDDGNVSGYDAFKIEALPKLSVYHPSFEIVEKLVTGSCEDLRKIYHNLKTKGFVNAEIELILEGDKGSIKSLRNPASHYAPVKPAALYGPSGVGKSSTTNSILGFKKAAFENSSDRGTYVPTEFRAASGSQEAPWEIHVPFLSSSQTKFIVSHHVANIFERIGCDEDEVEQEDMEDLEQRYTTGLDFFYWLFRDQKDFKTPDHCAQYFRARGEDGDDEDSIAADLMEMISSFLKTRSLQDGREIHAAQDENSLAKTVKDIARPSKGRSGSGVSPWPLVEKIEIRLEHKLLGKGVIIADLAGISDTSATVVESTRKYISNAGAIYVFATHKRIESDAVLDAQLRECVGLGKSGDVVLVVTHIDSHPIYAEAERDDLPASDLSLLKKAELKLRNLQAEDKQLQREKKKASGSRKSEINDRLDTLQEDLASAKARVRQVCIEIRCRQIKTEMSSRLQRLERNQNAPELPIIFVSNAIYQQHVNGFSPTDRPDLDVEATGIPSLRRHLFGLAAGSKFHTLRRICRVLLPNMVSGALGVLTKSKLERLDDGRMNLDILLDRRSKVVKSVQEDVVQRFALYVLDTMVKNDSTYKDKADKLLRTWHEDFKAVTFMAFCRKSGTHRPSGKSADMSWNAGIQKIFDHDVGAAFDVLEPEIGFIGISTASSINGYFATMIEALEACDAFQGVDITKLLDCIRRIRNDVENSMAKHCRLLKSIISQVRASMLVDTEKSLCSAAMQDTYNEIVSMQSINYQKTNAKGKTVTLKSKEAHKQRADRVRSKLLGTDDEIDIFSDVAERAKVSLDNKLAEWLVEANRLLAEGCQSIKDDFERRFAGSEDVKQEVDLEAVETLKRAAGDALMVIEGEMKRLIEECDAHGKAS
ncbi:hypothetical protein LTR86_000524 [Recurvomyces mirabilis]|nr:hypothetical protein LTR86_000524 [Recurvomyces mirabilis]